MQPPKDIIDAITPNRAGRLTAFEGQVIAFGLSCAEKARPGITAPELITQVGAAFEAHKGIIQFVNTHPHVTRIADPFGRSYDAVFELDQVPLYSFGDVPKLQVFFWNNRDRHVSLVLDRHKAAHVVSRDALWDLLQRAELALPLLAETTP